MKPATTPNETGWLPDLVFTGGKFETGLAFFADALGRITRFSREPADLAAARRLEGQAALPGLVNTHSRALHRLSRGRLEGERVIAEIGAEDVYDVARMVFMEMLLSGITCVGEFHDRHHQSDGAPWPEPNLLSHAVLRAARDTGLRISLFKVARSGDPTLDRGATSGSEQFLREMDALREHVGREHPADEVWLGIGVDGIPLHDLKEIAAYARAKRFRFHVPASAVSPQLLAEHGLLDKRVTVLRAEACRDEEVKAVGAARAFVNACPSAAQRRGTGSLPAAQWLAAGADVALGTGEQVQTNIIIEARMLEGVGAGREAAAARWHAATVAGARSLGAPSGALEVGRPADFFTVNLYDPSIAGASPAALLDAIVFGVERRAIRDVWMGARLRVAGGRHPHQGAIVGKFVELQRRWPALS